MDQEAVRGLEKIIDIDINDFGMEMFKKGTSLTGQRTEEIFHKDFKEFHLYGEKVGIAQVFTLDIEDVFNRKEEFIEYIKEVFNSKEHYLTLLLVTDILNEGSYLLFEAQNKQLLSIAFDRRIEEGDYVENLVSRKKQVLPKIMKAINILD
jgi:manganese-dependent inorganic pyrophosphatase